MPHFVTESFRLLKRYGSESLTNEFAKIVTKYRHVAASTGIDIDDIQELFSLVSGSHPKQQQPPNENKSKCLRAVIAHTLCFAHLEDQRRIDKKKNPEPETDESFIKKEQLTKDNRCTFIDYWDRRDNRSSEDMWSRRTVPWRHVFPTNKDAAGNVIRKMNPFGDLLNCCVYEAFLSYVLHRSRIIEEGSKGRAYQDIIITPNYDMVIEEALKSLKSLKHPCKIDYGEVVEHISNQGDTNLPRLKLVKLHGSLNWLTLENAKIWQEWLPLDDDRLFNADDAKNAGGKFIEKYGDLPLIPPTWQRHGANGGDSNDDLFDKLRVEALEQIQTAERIVIIGYSMPKTDLHIKYLMAHALIPPDYPAIEIWDIKPYAEMKDAIETMFGKTLAKDIKYHPDKDSIPETSKGLTGFVRSHSYSPKPS